MPAVEFEATIQIETEITLELSMKEYIWASKNDIQRYLDAESVIKIGDSSNENYSESEAQDMENGVVYEIITYLSSVYEITTESNVNLLKEITAMLTASKIGLARMGSSIGNDVTDWTNRLKNEAWASLQQRFVNQDISELTAKDVPLWRKMMFSKRREQAIVRNV